MKIWHATNTFRMGEFRAGHIITPRMVNVKAGQNTSQDDKLGEGKFYLG